MNTKTALVNTTFATDLDLHLAVNCQLLQTQDTYDLQESPIPKSTMDSNNWRVKRDPSELPARDPTTPNRELPRRDFGASRTGGFDQRRGNNSPSHGQSRDSIRQPLDSQQAEKTVEEGRRVYVGNLPYEATVKDIESLFVALAEGVEAINMSVDPMTGRNPSYCFVDFKTKHLAERAMEEYNGQEYLRRPLKVKPGVKSSGGAGTTRFNRPEDNSSTSSSRTPTRAADDRPAFDRWRPLETQDRVDKAVPEGRRLYVGGLPRFPSQTDAEAEITKLFASHQLTFEVISKVKSAHESTFGKEGNHNYCFVDMSTARDADTAVAALNGVDRWGWRLRVSRASGSPSTKVTERRRVYVGGLPEFESAEAAEAGIRELFGPFEARMVSRLLTPREPKSEEGNRCYCFVELVDEDQTDAAIAELDWKEIWGWKVRVKPALGNEKTEKPAPRGWRA